MKRRVFIILLIIFYAFLPLDSLAGRGSGQEHQDEAIIKLRTTLVQVPVTVRHEGGRYMVGLIQEDFALYEDGVRQKIEFFGKIEEPFSVALLLDTSGSTSEQLAKIKAGAEAFVDNLRPHDRVLIISFNDSVAVLCELTSDRDVLRRAIASVEPGEYTQVYEAVYTSVWERLDEIEGRKAVVLFTDGIDTASSEIGEAETIDAVIESEDVVVYPIRYNTRPDMERKTLRRLEEKAIAHGNNLSEAERLAVIRDMDRLYRKADEYLENLALLSGGVVERADDLIDLNATFGRIADELRHQYLLGYYPLASEKTDRGRKILVKVVREGARVRTRPGYRVPQ